MNAVAGSCEICGTEKWVAVYSGPVRAGPFGNFTEPTQVARCVGCGVERLAEATAKSDEFYHDKSYRQYLTESTDVAGFWAEHDILQLRNLEQLWPQGLRGKVIADVGCAAGSFLDHVRGLIGYAIAIEPCSAYHDSLKDRGYRVYSYAHDAVLHCKAICDWIFSFSVIEHVTDPRTFLTEAALLLKPGGKMMISTPNRRDVLMDLLPDIYPTFFYRSVHRWYWDDESVRNLAMHVGLTVREVRCVHRFGLSNTLRWLRDKSPGGLRTFAGVTPVMDATWTHELARQGQGDYLYIILERAVDLPR